MNEHIISETLLFIHHINENPDIMRKIILYLIRRHND